MTDIRQLLGQGIYDGLVAANSPGSGNPFVVLSDISSTTYTQLDDVINYQSSPPGAPTTGDRYLVLAPGSGAWVGQNNNIAVYNGATWDFTAPSVDDIVQVSTTYYWYRWTGTLWKRYPGISILQNGNKIGQHLRIGTIDNRLLYFKVNNGMVARFGNGNSGFLYNAYFGDLTTGAAAQIHVKKTSGDVFRADGTSINNILVVNSDGNVYANNFGVGISSSPSGKVHIKGSGNTSATISLYVENSDGTQVFTIYDSKQVVINSNIATLPATFGIQQDASTGYAFWLFNNGYSREYIAARQTDAVTTSMRLVDSAMTLYNNTGVPSVGLGSHYQYEGYLLNSRQDIKSLGSIGLFLWTDTVNNIEFNSVKNSGYTEPYLSMNGGYGGAANSGSLKLHTTLDSYVCVATTGTVGNFGVGTSSPTAKLQVKGVGTTSSTYSFLATDGSGNSILQVYDNRKILINGGSADNEWLGVRQWSAGGSNNTVMTVYAPAGGGTGRIVRAYNDGTGSDGTRYISFIDEGVSVKYIFSTARASLTLNSTAVTDVQLYSNSNGVNRKHIQFSNGTGSGFYMDQDASGYYQMYIISSAGSPTAHFLNSDSANNYLVNGAATQFLGIGTNTPLSKVDINAANGYAQLRMRTSYTPSSSADTNGNIGDIAWDDNYVYVRNSTQWVRSALSTF